MKIILVPATSPQAECIVFTKFPVVFGRGMTELRKGSYAQGAYAGQLSHVSRQHATFSKEQGKIYIEDSGSLNGTSVNGSNIAGGRVALASGDIILFADRLEFVVDLDTPPERLSQAEVLLTPIGKNPLQPVVLTRVPFAVNENSLGDGSKRSADLFASLPDHHAKILFEQEAILVAFRNQSAIRIDDVPVSAGRSILKHGSTVEFAPGLTYKFSCSVNPARAQGTMDHEDKDTPDDSTVYLNEATTFLKVFTSSDETEGKGKESTCQETADCKSTGHAVIRLPSGPFRKVLTVIVPICVLVAAAIFFYHSTDRYKVRNYYNEGMYQQCFVFANTLLSGKDSPDFQSLAKKSLMAAILPRYDKLLSEQQYQQIKHLLADTEKNVGNIPDGRKILDLLSFVADVHSAVVGKQQTHTVNDRDQQEKISLINRKWNKHQDQYRPLLNEFIQQEPSFRHTVETLYAGLNDTRELEIYELAEIEKIKSQIHLLARQGKVEKIKDAIVKFHTLHPGLKGYELWLDDLKKYALIVEDAKRRDLFTAAGLASTATMGSEIFEEISKEFFQEHYPSGAVLDVAAKVKELWQKGSPHKAIDLLERVSSAKWQEEINKAAARLRSFIALFDRAELKQFRQNRCPLVAKVYKQARPMDQYYLDVLSGNYSDCRNRYRRQTREHLALVDELFTAYINQGGITGKMRMEQEISTKFRSRADLLRKAHASMQRALEEMNLFQLNLSPRNKRNIARIKEEFNLQCVRIKESRVLSDGLIQKKLACFTSE